MTISTAASVGEAPARAGPEAQAVTARGFLHFLALPARHAANLFINKLEGGLDLGVRIPPPSPRPGAGPGPAGRRRCQVGPGLRPRRLKSQNAGIFLEKHDMKQSKASKHLYIQIFM